jgi:hypothetical protein
MGAIRCERDAWVEREHDGERTVGPLAAIAAEKAPRRAVIRHVTHHPRRGMQRLAGVSHIQVGEVIGFSWPVGEPVEQSTAGRTEGGRRARVLSRARRQEPTLDDHPARGHEA